MISSELITPPPSERRAVIYIRQSSPQQVISHQESLRLQYDLRQRAVACGWPEIRDRCHRQRTWADRPARRRDGPASPNWSAGHARARSASSSPTT